MRMALMEMLSTWGCLPDEAEYGEHALRLLREAASQRNPYRVALLDLHLSGLDGEALARAIRADQSLQGTLLMALTAVGRRGDAPRGLQAADGGERLGSHPGACHEPFRSHLHGPGAARSGRHRGDGRASADGGRNRHSHSGRGAHRPRPAGDSQAMSKRGDE